MDDPSTPPKWAQKFLNLYCPSSLIEEIEGDLIETFRCNEEKYGAKNAKLKYTIEVLKLLNPTTFKRSKNMNKKSSIDFFNSNIFHNHLRVARRSLFRNPGISLVHIGGFTIGIASFILAVLLVRDSFSYDRHHPDYDQTFRLIAKRGGSDQSGEWAGTSPATSPALQKEFPEVKSTLRLHQIRQKLLFNHNGTQYLESKGFFAEPAIFQFFDLPLKYGSIDNILTTPDHVVLSATLAQKYFGQANPVGKSIKINKHELKVVGVLKETMSSHSHLQFNYLLSFENLLTRVPPERMRSWVWQDFYNYIKLSPQSNQEVFNQKLHRFSERFAHPQTKEYGFYYHLTLQPLKDIHLYSSQLQNDVAVRGNYKYIYGLGFTGIFLLLIACINFINLTTAKAMGRAKEVGIRKTTGASKWQLITQFITEALLLVGTSGFLGIVISALMIAPLNKFAGRTLAFPWFQEPLLWFALLALIFIIALLSGGYPALVQSNFRVVQALSGSKMTQSGISLGLRKTLVVIQFAISTFLVISVIIIYQQINYLSESDLGFQREQILHFPMRGDMFDDFRKVKQSFLQIPGVASVSTCYGLPGDIVAGDDIIVPTPTRQTFPARIFAVDHQYISTLGMEIIAGRDFDRLKGLDADGGFIINETAVKNLRLGNAPEEAIGQPLEWKMWSDQDTLKKGQVIGVVKDFHYASLYDPIETAVLHIYPEAYWKAAISIESGNISGTLASIEETWKQFDTGYPLDYQFVDESFRAMYEEESKLKTLLWILTGLAIFIASIGALGLATHATQRRSKEISIRKILGASSLNIVTILSRDFLTLVLIGIVVSIPLAWYTSAKWLEDFAYHIPMYWWIFGLAAVLALGIASLTVGLESLRAALVPPVRALRDE